MVTNNYTLPLVVDSILPRTNSQIFAESKLMAIDRKVDAAMQGQLCSPKSMEEEKNTFAGYELLTNPLPPTQYLIEGLIPKVGLFGLVGSSDCGKSTLLRWMAIAVVCCLPFLNMAVRAVYRKALCIITEDDQSNISYPLRQQCANIDPEKLKNLHLIFSPENPLLEVESYLKNNKCDLVILDAWGDILKGDPKENGRVRQTLHEWHSLALRYGVAIGILHHTGKRTEQRSPDKSSILGAQSFEGKMRLVLELRADTVNPNYRHLTILKGNYLSTAEKSEARLLKFEDFIFTDTGERTAKELLATENTDAGKTKYDKIVELQDAGKTQREIAAELGYKSTASIQELIKKYGQT